MAVISLVGGLLLAYNQARMEKPSQTASEAAGTTTRRVQEALPAGPTAAASGTCATAVAGTIAASGAVSIGGCERTPPDEVSKK